MYDPNYMLDPEPEAPAPVWGWIGAGIASYSFLGAQMTAVILKCQQGSDEWHAARLGRITMSNAGKLLTGGNGITRRSYILDVAAERISGQPVERIQTWDMARGTELEPFALDAYCLERSVDVERIGLGYLDASQRISASPDGLVGADGGVEIKCPDVRGHMKNIDSLAADKAHVAQMQGNMWIFDRGWWDFVSFCPAFAPMPLLIIRTKRDDALIDRIASSAVAAVEEVDEICAAVQAHRYARPEDVRAVAAMAREHWERYNNDGEIQL